MFDARRRHGVVAVLATMAFSVLGGCGGGSGGGGAAPITSTDAFWVVDSEANALVLVALDDGRRLRTVPLGGWISGAGDVGASLATDARGGRLVLAGSADEGLVVAFDAHDGSVAGSFLTDFESETYVVWSYDSASGRLRQHDAASGEERLALDLSGALGARGQAGVGLASSGDPGRPLVLVGTGEDRRVLAFDALTGTARGSFGTAALGGSFPDAIAFDGTSVLLVDADADVAARIDAAASLASGAAVVLETMNLAALGFDATGGATGVAGSFFVSGAFQADADEPREAGFLVLSVVGGRLASAGMRALVPEREVVESAGSGALTLVGGGDSRAFFHDGTQGKLDLSSRGTTTVTVTNVDGSAFTGSETWSLVVEDLGVGSGGESLALRVRQDAVGFGAHHLQSLDADSTVRSTHTFSPGDVPGRYDVRLAMTQRPDGRWQVTPSFRLPGGAWTPFADGAWVTAQAFVLSSARVLVRTDVAAGGTLTLDPPHVAPGAPQLVAVGTAADGRLLLGAEAGGGRLDLLEAGTAAVQGTLFLEAGGAAGVSESVRLRVRGPDGLGDAGGLTLIADAGADLVLLVDAVASLRTGRIVVLDAFDARTEAGFDVGGGATGMPDGTFVVTGAFQADGDPALEAGLLPLDVVGGRLFSRAAVAFAAEEEVPEALPGGAAAEIDGSLAVAGGANAGRFDLVAPATGVATGTFDVRGADGRVGTSGRLVAGTETFTARVVD